jgi:hypothetical protein
MGPEKNSKLYNKLAKPREASLTDEFMRRNLLSATLAELSELFDEKDNTTNPVTEPTMLGKLYALMRVQRSHMGVAGFEPMDMVYMDGTLSAKVAPAHDSYELEDEDGRTGNIINTRVIKLTMPDKYSDEQVEVFGLNIYMPDIDTHGFFESEQAKLLIVGESGKVQDKPAAVTGETVAFAVRNKITQDAKLYKVEYLSEHMDIYNPNEDAIVQENETSTTTTLPDNQSVRIEVLPGELQTEMVEEIRSAIEKLKGIETKEFSDVEKHVVADILGSSSSHGFMEVEDAHQMRE